MELRATREGDESSRNNSTFTDGEDEKVVLLFERVLSQFVPRSRRSRRRALQNSHDELEARDDDNDDDGGINHHDDVDATFGHIDYDGDRDGNGTVDDDKESGGDSRATKGCAVATTRTTMTTHVWFQFCGTPMLQYGLP